MNSPALTFYLIDPLSVKRKKYYHWVQFQQYLQRESCSILLPLHFPPICLKIESGYFWPFFTICACLWATPWSHLHLYWKKYYDWVLLQWNLQQKSYSRLLPPHTPAISLKIASLAIFCYFLPFVPAQGKPLIPPLLLLMNMLSPGAVTMISMESYSRLLPPHFLAICLKIEFLVFF